MCVALHAWVRLHSTWLEHPAGLRRGSNTLTQLPDRTNWVWDIVHACLWVCWTFLHALQCNNALTSPVHLGFVSHCFRPVTITNGGQITHRIKFLCFFFIISCCVLTEHVQLKLLSSFSVSPLLPCLHKCMCLTCQQCQPCPRFLRRLLAEDHAFFLLSDPVSLLTAPSLKCSGISGMKNTNIYLTQLHFNKALQEVRIGTHWCAFCKCFFFPCLQIIQHEIRRLSLSLIRF